MSITITITDPTSQQLAALFGSAPKQAIEAEEQAKPATRKAADKPKAEEPAADKEEPKSDVPSHDDVVAAAQALVGANGREALAELLGEFDAKNLSGIGEDKRAAFIEKAQSKTK